MLLAGCATMQPSASVPVNLPALPSRYMTVSCAPTALPKGALTQAQVEKLWAKDRATLAKCGYSLGGLIAFYTDLSGRLSAAGKK
jgi:hypothetical protein